MARRRSRRQEPTTESGWQLITLAHDVQHELGPDVVVLLRGRPLGEHRRP
ncbi:hypothetical protein [Blastococcus sp. TF02-8]|nr:hypothetical protein [Blastococcus sp. TF02-8]